MNKLLALLAFVTFAGFVLILMVEVPELDLLLVGALTLALVVYDFLTSASDKKD